MRYILTIVQIIVSVLLMGAILLQTRGTGLSSSFGGGGEFYSTRRGMEKALLTATVILVALFLILSLLALVVK